MIFLPSAGALHFESVHGLIQHFGSYTNYQDAATEKVDIMSEKVKKDVLSKLSTAFIGVFRKVEQKMWKNC